MTINYSLNWSDDSIKTPFTLIGGTIDTSSTSLALTGRGSINWGEPIMEDLMHLLEHFASPNPPRNPTVGQLWYNTTLKQMMLYSRNNVWRSAGTFAVPVTPTPTPTKSPIPTTTATSTPTPTPTSTPAPSASSTPAPSASSTPAPSASSTPAPSASSTPAPSASSTPALSASSTPTPTPAPLPQYVTVGYNVTGYAGNA